MPVATAALPGDVIVHVTVKTDAVFERDGYDVYVRVPITYSQAVLGAEIEVPTVDGKVAQKIPEGTRERHQVPPARPGHPVLERPRPR